MTEKYEGSRRGNRFASHSVMAVPEGGLFVRTLIDSEHGDIMVLRGRAGDDGITFLWSRDTGGRLMMVRHRLILQSDDAFSVEGHLSTDSGASWQLTRRWNYRRTE